MEYKSENKICQNCHGQFIIEPEDFNFYKKIKVPLPTFCPECSFKHHMIWRNERSLYWRNCDLCKKRILSMYSSENLFPIYCHECWISDNWDPIAYGMQYDFKETFFTQFKKLQKKILTRQPSYSQPKKFPKSKLIEKCFR